MTNGTDRTLPRLVRDTMPLVLDVAIEIAKSNGVCIRPIELRRQDIVTGQIEPFDLPCGTTQEAKCPPCAKRNQQLRKAQCREGWHLDHEPTADPAAATEEQRWLVEFRADVQAKRDQAGEDVEDWDAAIVAVDAEINEAGMRGNLLGRRQIAKRTRSTRRRQDAPDLPKRTRRPTTLGRTFTSSQGQVYRPSMFVTLTLPSYGKIRKGAPADPTSYDYRRAARDALHFSKLVDRFVQNLRRVAGYDVQYFASVEPQKRLAPHLHMAIRGTLPRAEMKQIAAATYHQVWWPPADEVKHDSENLPIWNDEDGYLDPATGEILPTWDQALDDLEEPLHVLRFGDQADVQGVLAGSPAANKALGYLTKYLTKSLGDPLDPDDEDQARRDHVTRMLDALRYEPCSPTCPNWLRYGVQPKDAKRGMTPGHCRGKAHRPEHLGYAGRRVLVSRKWSNKTLREHKQDRRAWALELLGLDDPAANDRHRYIWHPVSSSDPTRTPRAAQLLRGIARRQQFRASLLALEARATGEPPPDLSATGKAA
ncbi:replication initiator [Nonomuraea sp. bgisy101]|uniref:replication initiator n=1 Tax=Nonomuraea sp. bgisy101 TaxID=3413784 RepID=UPI003D70799D